MPDQIIDALMAHAIQADAVRTHPLAVRVIVRDSIDYPAIWWRAWSPMC